jgi:hypothetical protein
MGPSRWPREAPARWRRCWRRRSKVGGRSNPRRTLFQVGLKSGGQVTTYATPELRALFEEWLGQIEAEFLEFLQGGEAVAPENVADHFKLSKESAVFLLSKLAREGKIIISVGQSK